jgi:Na+/melibiose symporter-like transporter
MFLMLSLYMQQVLELSPLETGVGYLAVAGTAIIWANVAAAAVTRVGVKPALVFGMALFTVGLLYFTQVSPDGSYWADLFPGFLIIGLGMPFAYVSITIAAVAGTKPQEAGLASGLINTSQQIGGAVGIAILTTIAVSHTDDAFSTGASQPVALTDGFAAAFWAGAAISFAGLLVSIFLVRGRDLKQEQESRVPEPVLEPAPERLTRRIRSPPSRRVPDAPPGYVPEMRFRKGARLDTSQVEDYRGQRTGSQVGCRSRSAAEAGSSGSSSSSLSSC